MRPNSSSLLVNRQLFQRSFHCCPHTFNGVEVWWQMRLRQHLNDADAITSCRLHMVSFFYPRFTHFWHQCLKGLSLKYSSLPASDCASVIFGQLEQYLPFRLFCCLLKKKTFWLTLLTLDLFAVLVGLIPAWMWLYTASTSSYKLHQHKNSKIQVHQSNFNVSHIENIIKCQYLCMLVIAYIQI